MVMNKRPKQNILWLDCIGGLVVGVIVLFACRLISKWDSLPLWIIIGVGIVNLVYGSYSLWLTTRNPRPMVYLKILAFGNMVWLIVCIALVATHWQEISLFGVVHKLGEGAYVAWLGYTNGNGEVNLLAETNVSNSDAIWKPSYGISL